MNVRVSVEAGGGGVAPFYVRFRRGSVARTEEAVPGAVALDYDAAGRLLGLEVLGECGIEVDTEGRPGGAVISSGDDLLQPTADNLAPLVVIWRAARLSGDYALECSALRELRERYGVVVKDAGAVPRSNAGDAN